VQISASSASGRPRYEDDWLFLGREQAAIVCDGMGGNGPGDVASRVAVWTFAERIRAGDDVKEALVEADRRIADCLPRWIGMACAVALRVGEGQVTLAHIGNCRAYRLRDGVLSQVTVDHSLAERYRAQGQIPPGIDPQELQYILTRSLGAGEVDVQVLATRPGDLLLLCSDGLHRTVPHDEIARALAVGAGDPDSACRALLAAAAGATDDVTVCVARIDEAATPGGDRAFGSPPTARWLYAPDGGALEPVPERFRAFGATSDWWAELWTLVTGAPLP
jgi:PPM family protein phosphatase